MTLTPEQRDDWRANALQGGTGWPHETLALLDALTATEAARDTAERQVQVLGGLVQGFRDAAEDRVTDLDVVLRDLGLDGKAGR